MKNWVRGGGALSQRWKTACSRAEQALGSKLVVIRGDWWKLERIAERTRRKIYPNKGEREGRAGARIVVDFKTEPKVIGRVRCRALENEISNFGDQRKL